MFNRVDDIAGNDTDISLPVAWYVWQLSAEKSSELSHTSTDFPWSLGMSNVCDESPAVGNLGYHSAAYR